LAEGAYMLALGAGSLWLLSIWLKPYVPTKQISI
jgi:hypothetical protein